MSIPNWRDDKVEISKENRLNIDVLYATHCIVPSLKKVEVEVRKLESEDHFTIFQSELGLIPRHLGRSFK